MKKILFVCLGNICRSPLAEAIAKKEIAQQGYDLYVESRGTGDWHIGEMACEGSLKVAKLHGIDLTSHRAKQITQEDIKNFDIIVGLDRKNIASLKQLGVKNPLLLGDFGYAGADVPDPYFFNGFEGFEKVFEMIEVCVKDLLEKYSK